MREMLENAIKMYEINDTKPTKANRKRLRLVLTAIKSGVTPAKKQLIAEDNK